MMEWVKQYFRFSNRELRGMQVLVVLIGFGLIWPYLLRPFISAPMQLSPKQIEEVEAWMAAMEQKEVRPYESPSTASQFAVRHLDKPSAKPIARFTFDPNTLEEEGWIKLGFSRGQIRVIQNYLRKGGVFKKPEDLKRIFSVSEKDYARVKDLIQIAQVEKEVKVELNTADSLSLLQLKGIGPAFASRILKYRNRLGGFVDKQQLLDVYGMDEERFSKFEQQVWVDTTKITGIQINHWDEQQLGKHPLVGYKLGEILVRYRQQHGEFANVDDLKNVVVLEVEQLKKLRKYLVF